MPHPLLRCMLQAVSAARQRLLTNAAAQPQAVLAGLHAELAGAGVAKAMTADTKELHGSVSKLGKVRAGGRRSRCMRRAAGSGRGKAWKGRSRQPRWLVECLDACLMCHMSHAAGGQLRAGRQLPQFHLCPGLIPLLEVPACPVPNCCSKPLLPACPCLPLPAPACCCSPSRQYFNICAFADCGPLLQPRHCQGLQARPPTAPCSAQPGRSTISTMPVSSWHLHLLAVAGPTCLASQSCLSAASTPQAQAVHMQERSQHVMPRKLTHTAHSHTSNKRQQP